MASTYSPDLRIELIQTGQQTGIWGNTTNTNLGTLLEQAIAGAISVQVTSTDQALVAYNGVSDQARNAAVDLTVSAAVTAAFNVYIPPVTKLYAFRNSSAYTATIYASSVLGNTTAGGVGVAIPAGASVLLRCDGTNVLEQLNQIVGTLNVGGVLTVDNNVIINDGLTVTGSSDISLNPVTTTISLNNTAAVFTVAASSLPLLNTKVRFTTTGTLPEPLLTTRFYYARPVSGSTTTFNVSTTTGAGGIVGTTTTGSGTHSMYSVPTTSTAPAGTNNTGLANTEYVTTAVANVAATIPSQTKQPVKVATTTAITLSGAQTIDGTSVVAEDRVLVKNQYSSTQTVTISIGSPAVITIVSGTIPNNNTQVVFTTTGALPTGITANAVYYVSRISGSTTTYNLTTYPSDTVFINTSGTQSGTQTAGYQPSVDNGIYVVKSGASPSWVRATDADTGTELAAATVPVLRGDVNGGKNFTTTFASTSSLGSISVPWFEVVDSGSSQTLINKTINAAQLVNASITPAKLNGAQTGNAPIYGVRAWINMNGTLANTTTISGTFSRSAGSTTATISISNHGFSAGQIVYITFGAVITNDWFIIQTVPSTGEFTITTSATTAAAGSASIKKAQIIDDGNVDSAIYGGIGSYAINFTTAMPSYGYAWSGSCGYDNVSQNAWVTAPPNVAYFSWKEAKFLRFATVYANTLYSTVDPREVTITVIG